MGAIAETNHYTCCEHIKYKTIHLIHNYRTAVIASLAIASIAAFTAGFCFLENTGVLIAGLCIGVASGISIPIVLLYSLCAGSYLGSRIGSYLLREGEFKRIESLKKKLVKGEYSNIECAHVSAWVGKDRVLWYYMHDSPQKPPNRVDAGGLCYCSAVEYIAIRAHRLCTRFVSKILCGVGSPQNGAIYDAIKAKDFEEAARIHSEPVTAEMLELLSEKQYGEAVKIASKNLGVNEVVQEHLQANRYFEALKTAAEIPNRVHRWVALNAIKQYISPRSQLSFRHR